MIGGLEVFFKMNLLGNSTSLCQEQPKREEQTDWMPKGRDDSSAATEETYFTDANDEHDR